ncbi:MAG: hypothetical protein WCK90_04635 [archaeon]
MDKKGNLLEIIKNTSLAITAATGMYILTGCYAMKVCHEGPKPHIIYGKPCEHLARPKPSQIQYKIINNPRIVVYEPNIIKVPAKKQQEIIYGPQHPNNPHR